MTTSKRIYGIDLGTTYSCIAYVDEHGKPTVIASEDGGTTTIPSVVYFESPGNVVVGQAAKDVAELYPDRVVSTVKRSMGNADSVFDNDGTTLHPPDISAYILKKLVQSARTQTGDDVTEVVITCPAYFGVNERKATEQAGIIADLKVRSILNEPTAAAIAYGVDHVDQQVIMVYDLGGGTFDITVIHVRPDAIEVVCTGGDHHLGGRQWDEAIASWCASQFSDETGTPAEELTNNPETWQELLIEAEKAKFALTSREKYPMKIRHDGDRVALELTREKFDELTADLLAQTMQMTDEVLKVAATKGHGKIDKLLLVGGSTYMPQVITAVKDRFPFEVVQHDPNQAVAKGAALFAFKCELDDSIKHWVGQETGQQEQEVDLTAVPAEVLEKAQKQVAQQHGLALPGIQKMTRAIVNVSSKSFGVVVKTEDGQDKVKNLIQANDKVPCEGSQQFSTYEDGQSGATIRCMENAVAAGPHDPAIDMEGSAELGRAELHFSRSLPGGSPIELSFRLNEDGLLFLRGKDLTTGGEVEASFETAAVLSEEQVEAKKSANRDIVVS